MYKKEAVLCLGGNMWDRKKLLLGALEALEKQFLLLRVSSIYETDAWGGVAQGKFLNQIAIIATEKTPDQVLEVVQGIERQLGRVEGEVWGNRTMDIDILYFGNDLVETASLQIPHPYISQRRFVLEPLVELLPGREHPVTGKTSREMLEDCEDTSEVRIYEVNSPGGSDAV